MTVLIVAFRNFANAPENIKIGLRPTTVSRCLNNAFIKILLSVQSYVKTVTQHPTSPMTAICDPIATGRYRQTSAPRRYPVHHYVHTHMRLHDVPHTPVLRSHTHHQKKETFIHSNNFDSSPP